MKTFILFLLIHGIVCFAITKLPTNILEPLASPTPTTLPSITGLPLLQTSVTTTNAKLPDHQVPFSALVTIAPLMPNPLERRQKCWDDRGFSVNCATWTGYYYTWGPPGDPHKGGPGEGGGGSGGGGNGGGSVVVYQGQGYMSSVNWPAVLGLAFLTLVLFV